MIDSCLSDFNLNNNDNINIFDINNADILVNHYKKYSKKIKDNTIITNTVLDYLVQCYKLFQINECTSDIKDYFEQEFISNFKKYDLFCIFINDDNINRYYKFIYDYLINKYHLKLLKINRYNYLQVFEKEKRFFNLRVDIHQHLGIIPRNQNIAFGSEFEVTKEEFIENIIKSNLTDVVVLYSNYYDLEFIQQQLPNINLYGLQYIKSLNDKLDIDKPLFKGIKLHNRRNTDNYSYSDSGIIKLLNKLREDDIILFHTQTREKLGECNLDEINRLASKYKQYKFILGHSGAYGLHTAKPLNFNHINYFYFLRKYLNTKSDFYFSADLSMNHSNIFCDSSIYTPQKGKSMRNTLKFGIGTDFPFNKSTISFDKQITQYIKTSGMCFHMINKSAWLYLNTHYNNLNDVYNEFLNSFYVPET